MQSLKKTITISTLWVMAAALFVCTMGTQALALDAGKGSYTYVDKATGKSVPVWYYKPASATAQTPVVFVLHGIKRDADSYRDTWAPLADEHGFIVLTPEFTNKAFPGIKGYNLGNMFADLAGREKDRGAFGPAQPKEKWSYGIIEKLFDDFRTQRENSQQQKYYIYGHSAGAQFLTRFMLFEPQARVALAVAANSGWYTMPDFSTPWPYGLEKTSITPEALAQYFTRPLVLMIGEKDNNPNGKNVAHDYMLDVNGMTRFERTKNFLAAAQKKSAELKVTLAWGYQTVPDVGHSNSRMSPAAAALIGKAIKEAGAKK